MASAPFDRAADGGDGPFPGASADPLPSSSVSLRGRGRGRAKKARSPSDSRSRSAFRSPISPPVKIEAAHAPDVVPPKAPRPINHYPLDLATEQLLLEWIRENPILWNSKNMDFKKPQMKNALWEEKGKCLEKTGDYLKRWWKGIRDAFTRVHKMKFAAAAKTFTEREQWILTHCDFFSVNVSHRSKSLESILPEALGNPLPSQPADDDSDDALEMAEAECGAAARAEEEERKRKNARNMNLICQIQLNILRLLQQRSSQGMTERQHMTEREYFAEYVANSIQRLPSAQYCQARAVIFSLIHGFNKD